MGVDDHKVVWARLDGGITNAGNVVRVGPHVLRPSCAHSGSIHAFLRTVRQAGFDTASPLSSGQFARRSYVAERTGNAALAAIDRLID